MGLGKLNLPFLFSTPGPASWGGGFNRLRAFRQAGAMKSCCIAWSRGRTIFVNKPEFGGRNVIWTGSALRKNGGTLDGKIKNQSQIDGHLWKSIENLSGFINKWGQIGKHMFWRVQARSRRRGHGTLAPKENNDLAFKSDVLPRFWTLLRKVGGCRPLKN